MNILELRVKLGVFKEMNILGEDNLQFEIEEKFKVIFNQLEKVMKGEKIDPVDSYPYIELISQMSDYFLNFPLTEDICTYFNFLTEVLYNWSANCLVDKKIQIFSMMLNRLIEIKVKLIYSTDIMKDSFERYVELASWQPPIFDLAVNYFDKMLEENEKGNKVEDKVQSCGT